MSTQAINIIFLIFLTHVFFFTLLKFALTEVHYWLGMFAKPKGIYGRLLVVTILTISCSLFGFINFGYLDYFWEVRALNILETFVINAFWLSCLISLAYIDLQYKLLPYCLTVTLAVIGFSKSISFSQTDFFDTVFLSVILISVCVSHRISAAIKGKFGLGDVFFIFGLSFWLETFLLSITVFLSAATMFMMLIIFKQKLSLTQKTRLPFGPALSFFAITVELLSHNLILMSIS